MNNFGPSPFSPLEFAVIVFAVARITRFIVFDYGPFNVMGRIREFAGSTAVGKHGGVAEFFNCPWCISIWVTILVVAGLIVEPGVTGSLVWILAISFGSVAALNFSVRR